MFPGASSDIGSDKFEPAYYLLDKHRFSNFEVRPFRFKISVFDHKLRGRFKIQ